jgi:serine protein kinase
MGNNTDKTLHHHVQMVKQRKRAFENAFQGVSRMILENGIQ